MLSGNWAQTVWDLQQNNVALNYAEGAQLSPARTVGKRAWEIGTQEKVLEYTPGQCDNDDNGS